VTGPHPTSPPDACSVLWEVPGLAAAGTAASATFWVALEQNGPWGRNAITESHLDPVLGADLADRCSAAGGRLLLIREPGGHADQHQPGMPHRVLVAGGLAERPFLLSGTVTDPAELLALPLDALAGDGEDAARAAVPSLTRFDRAALLVCTNGRRDVCCAVRGRPLALAAAAARPGQVWEASHTGGHRMAPTALTLPSGHLWARLTDELALAALDAETDGRLAEPLNTPWHNRGRSCLPPAVQAAEAWWRAQEGERRLGGIAWAREELDNGERVRLTHQDGRVATLRVRQETDPGERRDSCGKALGPSRTWHVDAEF
jgi:hypothetical protein